MSSRKPHLFTAVAIGIALMLSPAYAFNPQPDPPASAQKAARRASGKFIMG